MRWPRRFQSRSLHVESVRSPRSWRRVAGRLRQRTEIARPGCGHGRLRRERQPQHGLAWTQTAIEHDLIYREVYRQAGEKLLLALKDRAWDALPRNERKNAVKGLKPAVILDLSLIHI